MSVITHKTGSVAVGEPFESMEELWFWFMAANAAKNAGARYSAGLGHSVRPCEPADIITILERMYRNRQLDMNHLRILRHYGERGIAPDRNYPRERRAWYVWREALNKIKPVCERKGLVRTMRFSFFDMHKAINNNPNFIQELQGAY